MLLCRSRYLASSSFSPFVFVFLLAFSYWDDGFDSTNRLQDLHVARQHSKMTDKQLPSRTPFETARAKKYGTFYPAVPVHSTQSNRTGSVILRRASAVATLLFFAVAGYSGVYSNHQTVDLSDTLQFGAGKASSTDTELALKRIEKAFVEGVDIDNLRAFQHKFSR